MENCGIITKKLEGYACEGRQILEGCKTLRHGLYLVFFIQ